MNPVSRLLAGIAAILLLAAAVFFGVVVLVVALGLGLLGWSALMLRLWWLRRRGGAGPTGMEPPVTDRPAGPERGRGEVIDGDYEIISRHREN